MLSLPLCVLLNYSLFGFVFFYTYSSLNCKQYPFVNFYFILFLIFLLDLRKKVLKCPTKKNMRWRASSARGSRKERYKTTLMFCSKDNYFILLSLYKSRVPDPLVFGPPGSGSVTLRYGIGSVMKQKKQEKPDSYCFVTLWLLNNFLSLKKDGNVPFKSNSKFRNFFIFVGILEGH